MKFVFICVAMPFCLLQVSAQEVPVMVEAVETAPTDSLKVAAYHKLSRHYQYSNMDSAMLFAQAGLAYARQHGYRHGEAVMICSIGELLERHGMPEQARSHYAEAQAIYRSLGDKLGVAWTTNGLGVVAGRTSQYSEATRHFLDALSLYEEINHQEGIVQTYIKLGVVSDYLGDLDQALAYYLKAEEINRAFPASNASLTLLNNIGVIHGRRNDLRAALQYFRRGVELSAESRNTGIHITLLGSLGLAYDKLGMADSAWYFQQMALSMARQSNLPEEEARSLVNLAALVSHAHPEQSLELLRQALTITQDIQHLVLMTEVYEAMIEIHKESHQYKVAMELSEKNQLLKDSLFTIEKSREIANLHATQELARQENEIRNLALRNEKSVYQRNIFFGVAIVSVVMIFIVWFYNARISTLNRQLVRKQEELKTSNNVKDKLFSVLGHDLRAPLSRVIGLLDMLVLKSEDREESAVINKLKQQAHSTLETLDNLLMWGQNQLKGVRLQQQTLKAKEQVGKSISLSDNYAAQKQVRLVDNISPEVFIHADPSHFDFVIRNLLSNAIKFSHSGGSVAINAHPFTDSEVIFSIADSGVGIPESLKQKIFTPGNESGKGTWNEKGTGIGLMLCREYIAENGGRLWVESTEGEGSTFYFTLRSKITASSPT